MFFWFLVATIGFLSLRCSAAASASRVPAAAVCQLVRPYSANDVALVAIVLTSSFVMCNLFGTRERVWLEDDGLRFRWYTALWNVAHDDSDS